jgi:hypothetical protein
MLSQVQNPCLDQTQKHQENVGQGVRNYWEFIDPASKPPKEQARLVRLNCLGSLYYFIKVALGRSRLTNTLHYPICLSLEREHIKDVYELPRDHFKSTICSEGLPMWWALPMSQQDADDMILLGYTEEYVNYQKRIHDALTRVLLVSENITNAAKLGTRIRRHFESNSLYRALFPETLPTAKETWTNTSLHVRRPTGTLGFHGEGTFDFLGIGSALQSRHYRRVVEDDLVGRKAIESPSIMDKTIEYHQLIPGAFETVDKDHENDELYVGNRWGYADLNSHIREHEPWFRISSHSAMGGCCAIHPPNTPIFPEEFSEKKLQKLRRRLGGYTFSCQYLNNPAAPEDAIFKESWLGYFRLYQDLHGRDYIVHDPRPEELDYAGRRLVIRKNLYINNIAVGMATDPAHAGNASARRCRHAIIVAGISTTNDTYVLDAWARSGSYDEYVEAIYRMCRRWGLREFGLETIAAQRYLKYHLEYRNRIEDRKLRVRELLGEVEAPDGTLTHKKQFRIRAIVEPLAETGHLWIQKRHLDLLTEYVTFPTGRYCDQLDALAYIPQVVQTPVSRERKDEWTRANEARLSALGKSYSMRVA